tara:strand:+ start:2129 stop:3163 length:1035 start_codon:yes stop_codon:yes gene_type:complete
MLYSPQIFIEGKEILELQQFTLNFQGSNQLNTLNATFSTPDLDKNALFGKKIELFLNCGTQDNMPIYRGIIKNISSSETSLSIQCLDPRTYISGNDAKTLVITDEDNYDGYTAAQFLRHVIDNNINKNNVTNIGLDFLIDTDVLVNMTGVRETGKPLDLIVSRLDDSIDEATQEEPLTFVTDIIEGPNYSNLVIVKQKPLTTPSSLNLSLHDGVIDYTYKRRPTPTSVDITSGDRFSSIQLGSPVHGPFSVELSKEFSDPAEAQKFGILHLKRLQQQIDEIEITASKGHYCNLESIIDINVDSPEIDGPHRLVSKNISYNSGSMSLQLGLNKRPIKVSEFLSKA